MGRSPDRRLLLSILMITVLAGSVRVSYILVAKGGVDTCGADLCGDAIWYSAQANDISDGKFFKDPFGDGEAADHPPLTPLVLAPASWLFPDSIKAQRLVMAITGTATAVLVLLIGLRLGGPAVGLIAGVMASLYPNLWMNDGAVMSESLGAAATAALILSLLRFIDRQVPARAVIAGVAAGAASLVRPELLFLAPIALLPTMFVSGSRRSSMTGAVVILLATAAVLTPWILFNLSRFERPVLVSTNDGLTLLGSNCEKVYGGGAIGIWAMPASEPFGDPDCAPDVPRPEGDQSVVSARYRAAAFEYAGQHLEKVPSVVLSRQGRAWSFYQSHQMWWYNEGEGRERGVSRIGEVLYKAMLPLSAIGIATLRRNKVPLAPLLAPAFTVALTATLFYGLIRFRVPAEISLITLASVGACNLYERAATALGLGTPLTSATLTARS